MKGGFGDIMEQAQKMQAQLQKAQEAMAEREVQGEAGAGLVKVTMNGRHDVRAVSIDPSVLSEDKSVLEDLLAGAVNDAVRRIEAAQKEALKDMTGGLPLPDGLRFPFTP